MESAELLDLLGNENRRRILRLLSRKPCYVTEIGDYLDVSPKAVIDHLEKLEEAGIVESRSDGSRRKYFNIARDVRLEVTVSRHEYGTKSAYPANPAMDIRGRCAYVRLDVEGVSTGSGDGAGGSTENRESGETTGNHGNEIVENAENVENRAGVENHETVESAEPTESGEVDESSEPTEDSGLSEPAENSEVGGPTENSEVGGPTENSEVGGLTENSEASEVGELAAEYDRLREMEAELSLAQRWVRGRIAELLDRLQTAVGAESDAQFHADLLAAVVSTDGSRGEIVAAVDAPPREVRRGLTRLVEAGILAREGDRYRVAESV